MITFRFLNFKVYHDSKKLYKEIIKLRTKIPYIYFVDQLERACLSVILNIAEGSAKISDKEFFRFLQISLGSINEVVACLDIITNNNFIDKKIFDKLIIQCTDIAKQLGGLTKKLKNTHC